MANPFKILLITELKDYRKLVSDQLLKKDCQVTASSGGFQAIHLLEKHPFNLVLLTEDMEDMMGIEIINLIRAKFTKEELPIIYQKDSQSVEEMLDFIQSGINHFIKLTKNTSSLLEKVEEFKRKMS